MVNIQIQDIDGSWRTVNTTFDRNMQNVTIRMNEAQSSYNGKRVRAVDGNTGALLDVR